VFLKVSSHKLISLTSNSFNDNFKHNYHQDIQGTDSKVSRNIGGKCLKMSRQIRVNY